ncbi:MULTISPECIES: class I SAM-dependent methyltransferase [unclassified Nocardioides]|uniref:class I SAM-dependent methyltransferase n=1 Tax=unclassified Nocardioides TaxID=2615069 RepID=UPI0012E3CE1E|nr:MULTISPECIES: class I SAM-dependent methyltransferase [unclassified Nocardioides]
MTIHACPVCGTSMASFDTAIVLEKHEAHYHRCPSCGMVATLETPWLEEAYSTAIHAADTGLLRRARRFSAMTNAVIGFEGLKRGRFLDWAGGYGVFTQMMRDRGLDYWQHDDFATPLFAAEYADDGEGRYDLITAFEVMEHLADPRAQLAPVAARTDRLLFTTQLLPDPAPRVGEWWYYMPPVGQHISFHTVASLRLVGKDLGFELTSNGAGWHLFHRDPIDLRTRALLSEATITGGRRVRQLRARATALLGR